MVDIKEDTIKHAQEAFAETIALKVSQLRRFVKKGTNSILTGDYIEEVVRSFINSWIGNRMLLRGTFYSSEFEASKNNPLQIDGIVYDPSLGPSILLEGNFIIVHPRFCTNVIEIKTTYSENLKNFKNRLDKIHNLYMRHIGKPQIMGVIISDKNPEKKSEILTSTGEIRSAYEYYASAWSPIFILFKELNDDYEPFYPAIEAMIKAIFTKPVIL